MANIQKTLTYAIPDKMYSGTTELGKTSTMQYDGPDHIILWIDKETGYLEQCHAPHEEPDSPLPLHLRREILSADNDINTIKIALLWGGIEEPKVYICSELNKNGKCCKSKAQYVGKNDGKYYCNKHYNQLSGKQQKLVKKIKPPKKVNKF